MDRGILSTIYVRPRGTNAKEVLQVWRRFYVNQPFIRVIDHLPHTKYVSGTNYCDFTARDAGSRMILVFGAG